MEVYHLYIAMLVCVVLIVLVVIFSVWQVYKAQRYVKDELTKFATLVNDAQYNEYVFDKMNEQNIKNMDERLNDVEQRLTDVTNSQT
jgi:NADH:ubiquinone oxidoreductase subunit 5 (subunit L)/multisubunit Na+/H+ antiporter MnhA subunit